MSPASVTLIRRGVTHAIDLGVNCRCNLLGLTSYLLELTRYYLEEEDYKNELSSSLSFSTPCKRLKLATIWWGDKSHFLSNYFVQVSVIAKNIRNRRDHRGLFCNFVWVLAPAVKVACTLLFKTHRFSPLWAFRESWREWGWDHFYWGVCQYVWNLWDQGITSKLTN